MNKKRIITGIILFFSIFTLFAQEKETYLFATKDTAKLYMDVYVPAVQNEQHACLFFVFGGGFIGGKRDDEQVQTVWRHFTEKGYVVIAIDYRLGMRGHKNFSALASVKQFKKSIDMAAEDLISAMDYTLKHLLETKKYKIDPKHFILMGSSAGAIAALQADYSLCNGYLNYDILPNTFRPAGIISYSGAIFSTHGRPKYKKHSPAPTLFCHGTEDKLVIYTKTNVFNIGLFGSSSIVKEFKKKGYGYSIRRYQGLGHQVAGMFRSEYDIMDQFLEKTVFGNPNIQNDLLYFNPEIEPKWVDFKVKDLKRFSN